MNNNGNTSRNKNASKSPKPIKNTIIPNNNNNNSNNTNNKKR